MWSVIGQCVLSLLKVRIQFALPVTTTSQQLGLRTWRARTHTILRCSTNQWAPPSGCDRRSGTCTWTLNEWKTSLMIATRASAGQCSPFPCLRILSPPSKWIWTKWCGGLEGGEASCGTRTGLEIHRLGPYSPLWTAWESCEQTHWFRQIHTHSPTKHTRHVDSVAAEEELATKFCRLLSNLSGEWQMSCVKTHFLLTSLGCTMHRCHLLCSREYSDGLKVQHSV